MDELSAAYGRVLAAAPVPEALIHRWDAENALGMDTPMDPELAGDGVAEVADTMAPRQIQRGRAAEPRHAVRFAATDTGGPWVLGPGDPVATANAAAGDLLLMLWGRLPPQGAPIRWDGDAEAAQAVLSEPLVP
ncbi:MAG: maleylpyruvate isomerase family mycothiol-dependent enzyme [Actinomycetota bacterium]|nr:maleylpyruvate isomerase family mycothiol-dependent enzyme [Actinomycetota bacterium]